MGEEFTMGHKEVLVVKICVESKNLCALNRIINGLFLEGDVVIKEVSLKRKMIE